MPNYDFMLTISMVKEAFVEIEADNFQAAAAKLAEMTQAFEVKFENGPDTPLDVITVEAAARNGVSYSGLGRPFLLDDDRQPWQSYSYPCLDVDHLPEAYKAIKD